jgi:hypothetical protein
MLSKMAIIRVTADHKKSIGNWRSQAATHQSGERIWRHVLKTLGKCYESFVTESSKARLMIDLVRSVLTNILTLYRTSSGRHDVMEGIMEDG